MPYQVIALRYRPRRFCEVVGQEEIAETLRRAILDGRLAHAYLFAGPRGVGKTSMARILAMALNCPNPRDGEPCAECDTCQDISAGSDLDVVELDAASHRGIDDVRNLIANASCAPLRAKVKVYIIDEVHMLTREAFNALLKTLEEPPGHVKFVMATTEPQRIPETVASRVQRFDFKAISEADVVKRLQQICEKERVKPQEGVLEKIAQYAHGAMRDAQTLLDQVITFAGKEVTLSDLDKIAGKLDRENLKLLLEAIKSGNSGEVWRLTRYALSGVTTPEGLLEQVLFESREEVATALQRDGKVPEDLLTRCEILTEALAKIRFSPLPDIVAELTLLRLCFCKEIASIGELLEEVRTGPSKVRGREEESSGGISEGSARDLKKARKEAESPDKKTPRQERSQKAGKAEPGPSPLDQKEREEVLLKIKQLWPVIVGEIRKRSVALAEFVRNSGPLTVTADGNLQLEVKGELFLRRLQKPESRRILIEALEKVLSQRLGLQFCLRKKNSSSEVKRTDTSIDKDPLYRKAREIFEAEEF